MPALAEDMLARVGEDRVVGDHDDPGGGISGRMAIELALGWCD
jgi:hypothetical protein